MDKKEQEIIASNIDKEIENFRISMQSFTKKEIYDNYYKINIFEEIAQFLVTNLEDYPFGMLNKDGLLESLYWEFLDNDNVDLNNEDLRHMFNRLKHQYEQEQELKDDELAKKIDDFFTSYGQYDKLEELEDFEPELTSFKFIKECLDNKNGSKFIIRYLNEFIDDDEREEVIKQAKELKKQVKDRNNLEM